MAGMFYSIEEAAQRLGKTEDELKELIDQGALREFRDGPMLLLKVSEIESLALEEGLEPAADAFGAGVLSPAADSEPEAAELEAADLEAVEAQQDELEMAEVEPGALDEAGLEIPESEAGEDALGDLDLDEFGSLESEEEIPGVEADEAEFATEDLLAAEEPAVAEPKTKAKRKRKEKPKREPKPKPIKVHRIRPQRLSFGQWLMGGLRDDDPVAVIVLILLLGVILAAIVAAVYGAYFAADKLL